MINFITLGCKRVFYMIRLLTLFCLYFFAIPFILMCIMISLGFNITLLGVILFILLIFSVMFEVMMSDEFMHWYYKKYMQYEE